MNELKKMQENNDKRFECFEKHFESEEYSGCEYTFNDYKCIQRTAKLTPKKTGLFVTFWKRSTTKTTTPFDIADQFQYFIIICHEKLSSGVFVFPKLVLLEKRIISNSNKGIDGKRGFRVYPAWCTPTNKQATSTQKWQLQYFTETLKLPL